MTVARYRRETLSSALVVCGAILVSALLVTFIHEPFAAAVRLPFRMLCHGIAARSFEIAGQPMPVCARCTGIYLGVILASAIGLAWRETVVSRFVAIALALPMAVDGIGQWMGMWTTGNAFRFSTGLLFGTGVILAVLGSRKGDSGTEVLESTVSMR